MGTLGDYMEKQDPFVTGNEQYEDSFGKFSIIEPPSGPELYATIKCLLWGIVKGYFRVRVFIARYNDTFFSYYIFSTIFLRIRNSNFQLL